MIKGRFAPSPTGRMHLGNVYSALLSWLSAKSQEGQWLLRIEDLDNGRSRMEYAEQIEDDLHWLGLDWDEGGIEGRGKNGPYLQSQRGPIYEKFLQILKDKGLIYPCWCTRADLMASQAPHESDGRVVYAGTCRPRSLGGKKDISAPVSGRKSASRLFVPSERISFIDRHYGLNSAILSEHCGDFIVRRADGAWAYQLAVVVDDALMGVTQVVRGRDLMPSALQQIYLYRLLGFDSPEFCHVPLLCSESGARLCKRDRSLDMGELRKNFSAEQIIGRLAFYAGLIDKEENISAKELLPFFDWDKIPTNDIICKR